MQDEMQKNLDDSIAAEQDVIKGLGEGSRCFYQQSFFLTLRWAADCVLVVGSRCFYQQSFFLTLRWAAEWVFYERSPFSDAALGCRVVALVAALLMLCSLARALRSLALMHGK